MADQGNSKEVYYISDGYFAARFCSNVIFRRPEITKITEQQVLKKHNGCKILRIVIHYVLMFRFEGLKIAVNKAVTL